MFWTAGTEKAGCTVDDVYGNDWLSAERTSPVRGYHRLKGPPQSLLCGERRSKAASVVFAMAETEESGLYDDEVVSKCALRDWNTYKDA